MESTAVTQKRKYNYKLPTLTKEQGVQFGKNLVFLRMKKGLRQQDISDKLQFSHAAIGVWEKFPDGTGFKPGLDSVVKVAKFFDLAPEDMMNKNLNDGTPVPDKIERKDARIKDKITENLRKVLPSIPTIDDNTKREERIVRSTKAGQGEVYRMYKKKEIANFLHNVVALRKHAHKSQQDIAELAGVSANTIHNIEHGKAITVDKMAMMAKALGVTMHDITSHHLATTVNRKHIKGAKPVEAPMGNMAAEFKKGRKRGTKFVSMENFAKLKEDLMNAIYNRLIALGMPTKQTRTITRLEPIQKEDIEAIILGMAQRHAIDLHVGNGTNPKLIGEYDKIVSELEGRRIADAEDILNLKEEIRALKSQKGGASGFSLMLAGPGGNIELDIACDSTGTFYIKGFSQ